MMLTNKLAATGPADAGLADTLAAAPTTCLLRVSTWTAH